MDAQWADLPTLHRHAHEALQIYNLIFSASMSSRTHTNSTLIEPASIYKTSGHRNFLRGAFTYSIAPPSVFPLFPCYLMLICVRLSRESQFVAARSRVNASASGLISQASYTIRRATNSNSITLHTLEAESQTQISDVYWFLG